MTDAGGKPVMEVPVETPTSPAIDAGPAAVTAWPPTIAKLPAAPSVWPHAREEVHKSAATATAEARPTKMRLMLISGETVTGARTADGARVSSQHSNFRRCSS